MEAGEGPARDPDRDRACTGCGWSGAETAMRGLGPGDGLEDPLALGCPRCGSPVLAEPPSVEQILAARRRPEA